MKKPLIITVVFEIPDQFRVITRSDSDLYYPQTWEQSALDSSRQTWGYIYEQKRDGTEERVAELFISRAKEWNPTK